MRAPLRFPLCTSAFKKLDPVLTQLTKTCNSKPELCYFAANHLP